MTAHGLRLVPDASLDALLEPGPPARPAAIFWRIPARAAVELGWPLCGCCGKGIAPGHRVAFRGLEHHPDCVARLLEAAA